MLICHCHEVSDRQIRAAVRRGAQSRAEVARVCRAGGGCGGCGPAIDQIVDLESRTPVRELHPPLRILAATHS